jgi:hypothetical protein
MLIEWLIYAMPNSDDKNNEQERQIFVLADMRKCLCPGTEKMLPVDERQV